MKELEEHVCIKCYFKLFGNTFTETFEMFQQAYGDDYMSRTQCYNWFTYFKAGRTLTNKNPRPRYRSFKAFEGSSTQEEARPVELSLIHI